MYIYIQQRSYVYVLHNIAMYVHTFDIPVGPSVTEAVATLVTPNENRTEYSIIVTCTVHPESDADMCVVMAMADGRMTRSGTKRMTISHAFYSYAYMCVCIKHTHKTSYLYIRMYHIFYITELYTCRTYIKLIVIHT